MYREIVNALVRHFNVLRRVPAYAGEGTVLARTIAIDRDGRPLLHRVVMLTPYGIETLVGDGKRAGRAGQLRVALPLEAPAAVAACIGTVIDRLQVAGVRVSIVRERRASGADDEPVSDGSRRPGAEDFVRLVPFLPLARSTLHELQKERLLTAYLAASGECDSGAERLAAQARETDCAAARLWVYVAAHRNALPDLALTHIDNSARLLGTIDAVRSGTVSRSRSAEDAVADYSRIDTELLAAVAAVVGVARNSALARLPAAHLAFLQTKEEIGMEVAHHPQARPAIEAATWLQTITAKLERLREVGDVHSAEIVRRTATRGEQ